MSSNSDKMCEFIDSIDDLNIFYEDGTASSSVIYNPQGNFEQGYVSYIGQFRNKNVSINFKYLDDNTCIVKFHKWGINNNKIDLTSEYINDEMMKDTIERMKQIGRMYFS